ncbi:hypothetical protein RHO15_07135 [Utexia brackfieldae]
MSVITAPLHHPNSRVWRSALAWQITLYLGLNSTIYYVIIGWLPAILMDAGISATQSGSLHGIMQLATGIPGLVLGFILRCLPDQRMLAVTVCLFSIVGLLGLLLAPQLALIWMLLFGLGTGAGIIIGLSMVGLRTHHPHQTAILSGMSQSFGYLLAAVGPIAMGALNGLFHSWSLVLWLCVLLAAVGASMGFLAGRNRYIS